ncbi:MAG TPA: tetratricopeptide repeat protein [Bryobacteraceae bacterium]|nr:tetratricopeptide repeat protein [Bryobacteraceae bacterium]
MTPHRCISLSCLLVAATVAFAQNQSAASQPSGTDNRATAYYNYSLGHLYSELAAAYGNRGDYFNKAVESYRAALKADPSATFIAEELSDLYIQSGRLREAVTEAEDQLKQNPNDLNARRLLARIYTRLIGDQANRVDESMVKKAIEQFEKITEGDPKDVESWLMLGRLNKIAQNSTEALKDYNKALALDPDNEDAMTGLAMVYTDLGDNKAAADLLRKVADKNPNPHSLINLAGVYEQLKDYPLAAEMLRRALQQQPGNAELKQMLAEDLVQADQIDEAAKLYQDLVDEDPKDARALLRLSQIYRQKGDVAKARQTLDKAKEIDATNIEVQWFDESLLEAEGKYPEAIKLLQSLLDATAKKSYNDAEKGFRVQLLERLGAAYRSTEQFGPAVDAFRQIADLEPRSAPGAEAEIVLTYQAAKDYPKAESEANDAVKKYPDDRQVRATHASVLAEMGKTDQAAAETRKLMDGKDDFPVLLDLADIYQKGKNWGEMTKTLDAAEKLAKNDDDKVRVMFLRGAMYERQKNYSAAEAEFRKVLAIDPNHAATLNYLGYMLADRGVRLDEAKDLILKALQREPNSPAYLDSLGWVYFRLNKLQDAEEKLQHAIQYMSRDATVHDHLAEVYFREGKIKEAIAQWQSSLKEWQTSSPSEMDHGEMAKVQKKLDDARVRLARETGSKQP